MGWCLGPTPATAYQERTLQRRVLVKVERKMFPDDPDVVAVGFADLIEGRTDPRAERSLKVGRLGNRYRSG